MATGGRRVESYYARGMLEIRTTLHLTLRLTIRVDQALELSGAASEGAGLLWRLALPAFIALDLVVWRMLRNDDRFGLAWRLPLDALDAAFWTTSPLPLSGAADLALLVAIPLGVEAGVRIGWKSMVVPAALFMSTSTAAWLVGKPLQIMGVMWIVVAAIVGLAFFRHCRHQDQRADVERQRVLAATKWRAFLAGQNQVAMGASSAVDVIEGLVPVLGRPPADSALGRLADGWKGQLSESTSHEAKYLQVAALEWERRHNAHPDLSGLVTVHLEAGHGTTLLTAPQVVQLHGALERLRPAGVVTIGLTDAETPRLPGQVLRLDVNGHAVVLPADHRAKPSPLDSALVAYLYVGVLVAVWALPAGGSVPPRPIAIGLALCVMAAIASHRRTVTHGERARPGVLAIAALVATTLTLLASSASAPLNADGIAIMGSGVGLILVSFLGGFYWRSLGRWRWLVPVAVGVNVVLGVIVFPDQSAINLRTVLGSLLYNVFPFFPCRHLDMALQRAADHHIGFVQTDDEGVARAAFRDGRESVFSLVREAQDDAARQLRALEHRLDPTVATLVATRLKEVDQRLRIAMAEPASSSSTTTG
jgi:hypothetical protein